MNAPQKRGTAPSVRRRNKTVDVIPSDTVSVAVISHNYGRYLDDALCSVIEQSYQPAEILVIDDSSNDNTAEIAKDFASYGVEYIRVETKNVWTNRLIASEKLSSKWVVCLDGDNMLSQDYLLSALRVAATDPKCGCIYPSLQRFGSDEGFRDHSRPVRNIDVQNFADASSVYRREAILQAALHHRHPDPEISAEDWVLAREIVRSGWTAHHNPSLLHYRTHDSNKHSRRSKHSHFTETGYFNDAALYDDPVTIIIPLSGRHRLWPMTARWLDAQAWPREQCRLVLIDNSHDSEFSAAVREWVASCDYDDVRFYVDRSGRKGLADEIRTGRHGHDREVHRTVAALYNRAFREAGTEYLLTLEDDIDPPLDGIEHLMRSMQSSSGGVTGAYKHREQNRYLAWRGEVGSHTGLAEKDQGVEGVDGCGFGFFLLRQSAVSQIQLRTDGVVKFYDTTACSDLRKLGWELSINWSVKCGHHAETL